MPLLESVPQQKLAKNNEEQVTWSCVLVVNGTLRINGQLQVSPDNSLCFVILRGLYLKFGSSLSFSVGSSCQTYEKASERCRRLP